MAQVHNFVRKVQVLMPLRRKELTVRETLDERSALEAKSALGRLCSIRSRTRDGAGRVTLELGVLPAEADALARLLNELTNDKVSARRGRRRPGKWRSSAS